MLLLVWYWCDLLGVYVGLGLGVLIVLLWMVLLRFGVFLDVLRLGSGCCDRRVFVLLVWVFGLHGFGFLRLLWFAIGLFDCLNLFIVGWLCGLVGFMWFWWVYCQDLVVIAIVVCLVVVCLFCGLRLLCG